jgi:hypothetical protein
MVSRSRASIVGSSYGGFIALDQAVSSPERVDLVLIRPAGFVSVMPFFRIFLRGSPPRTASIRRMNTGWRWAEC